MADTQVKEINGMFDGPILPLTLRLGIPILIGNVFSFLYHFFDTVFISLIDKSSTAIISGTAIIFPLFFLFLSLGNGILIGVSTLVARAIGEKNKDALNNSSSSGLFIASIIAVLLLIAGYFFIDTIVEALAGEELTAEALAYGKEYMLYLLPGLAVLLMAYLFIGILQGEGLTKPIAIAMTLSTVLNIILDPIFIFVLQMGVAGAALATTISMVIAFVYVIGVFISKQSSVPINPNIFQAKGHLIWEILRIGIPQSVQMIALSFSFIILNFLVSSIGQIEMNSWGLCGRVDQLLMLPAFAISSANITMIGQNFGRRLKNRLKLINRWNVLYGIISVVFLAIIYIILAPFIFRIFSDVTAVINGSIRQVQFTAFSFLGIVITIIIAGTFQGLAKPIPALLLTIFRVVITIIIALIATLVLNWGMIGIFISLIIGHTVGGLTGFLWVTSSLKTIQFRAITR